MILKLTAFNTGEPIYIGANAIASLCPLASGHTQVLVNAPVQFLDARRWWQFWKPRSHISCPLYHVRETSEQIQSMVAALQLDMMRQISREVMAGVTYTDRKVKPKADHLHVVEPETEPAQ